MYTGEILTYSLLSGIFLSSNYTQFQDTEKEYMLIGMLIGIAIYNSIILDIAFPTVIFKKLSGEKGTFDVSTPTFIYI